MFTTLICKQKNELQEKTSDIHIKKNFGQNGQHKILP